MYKANNKMFIYFKRLLLLWEKRSRKTVYVCMYVREQMYGRNGKKGNMCERDGKRGKCVRRTGKGENVREEPEKGGTF